MTLITCAARKFFGKISSKRLQKSVYWRIIKVRYGIGAHALKFLAVAVKEIQRSDYGRRP